MFKNDPLRMAEIYSILLAGMGASEESFVFTHFSGLGHEIIKARNLEKEHI